MSDIRKTILTSIIISLVVGTLAGVTGGVVATQFAYGDLGGQIASILPQPGGLAPEKPEASPPAPTAPAKTEETSVVDIVARVSPAVVSIVISKEITPQSTGLLFPSDLFREFGFEIETPQQQQPQGEPQKKQVGAGTGFIITSDGLIATNKHVAYDDNATYEAVLTDGKRYDARVLARDPFIDLALMKIEAKNLPVVKFGDSDKLQIGETVIAIGNALSEFSNTITKGVVSGIKRRVTAGGPGIGSEVIEEAIQTDAAINPGNSGGPLINMRGEVVGINTAVSQAGQNVGFAIPINQAKPAIESVRKTGKIVRPWLGVRYVLITAELKQKNNLPVDYGALIVRGDNQTALAITPSSPADKAGLRENDIILEIDGVKITQEISLAQQIQKHKPGDKITLKVLSQGNEKDVKAVLEEFKQ